MIPEDKSAAVTRGLHEAFGVTEFEDIARITKGHTPALVFRIVVRGRPYLLRIIMFKNLIVGPERQFTCMRAAAEAGLAPHVWYTSVEDKISITDFVDEVPFSAAEARVRMPATLRRLHALPPFPEGVRHVDTTCMFLMHDAKAADEFTGKFRAANILSDADTNQLLAWRAQLAAVYNRLDAEMVSSHNDLLKPDNILFDGKRVWLVDWEAAFLNDRYVDLAVVANLIVTDDAEESEFLQEYFGQAPSDYQLARFFLMRQITHLFYAMVFLLLGSAGQPVDWSEKAPGFEDFQRRMWAGEVNLADRATRIAWGRIQWERLVENMASARFQEALRIASDGRPGRSVYA
ncbi:MAG TPA: phosphotransferase [Bryobacteraceae bacterium]|nr:phosphotransferase [Bryobacteraceae bacterium]